MALINCPECGKEISDKALACPNCGCPIEIARQPSEKEQDSASVVLPENEDELVHPGNIDNSADNPSNAVEPKKKKIIVSAVISIAVIALLAIIIFPIAFPSVDKLCADGKYKRAYNRASDEEKPYIAAENIVAFLSTDISDNLKDPESFKLRAAYCRENLQQIAFHVSGNNSYGATVSGYWLYSYNDDDGSFELTGSVSDLEDEEYESYDDEEDRLEKALDNLCRLLIKGTMSNGIELSDDQIDRINVMFENDTLKEIELLDLDFSEDSSE